MKVATWGIGIFVLGLLGLVLINLFGNITVTNQFDYTTMKNAVQAAMLDSLDIAHYRAGFCLCTTDGSAINNSSGVTFDDKSQYTFRDVVDDKCVNSDGNKMNNCVIMNGEYRLDAEKFRTIFQERFTNVKSNNKEYNFVIKEIIEYPPKVSVRVVSIDDNLLPTEKDSGGYNIVNQIDAIIETNGDVEPYVETQEFIACFEKGDKVEWGLFSMHKATDGWTVREGVNEKDCGVTSQTPDGEHCYLMTDTKLADGQARLEWGLASEHKEEDGWKIQSGITKKKNCEIIIPTIPTGRTSSGGKVTQDNKGTSFNIKCGSTSSIKANTNTSYNAVC